MSLSPAEPHEPPVFPKLTLYCMRSIKRSAQQTVILLCHCCGVFTHRLIEGHICDEVEGIILLAAIVLAVIEEWLLPGKTVVNPSDMLTIADS